MHTFEILTATGNDAARWQHYVNRLPEHVRDVMFGPAYYRIQGSLGGTPMCALYVWDDLFMLQPFVLRDVPRSDCRDITSPYGFGGPVCNSSTTSSAAHLWHHFDAKFSEWRTTMNVVAEYCALSPVAAQHQERILREPPPAGPPATVVGAREVAVIRLDQSEEYLLAEAHDSRSQLLGKARRERLAVSQFSAPDIWIDRFSSLYAHAMVAKGAGLRWHFPHAYFRRYLDLMPERAFLLGGGHPESMSQACIVILGGYTAHYHFAARAPDAPPGMGELLIVEACRLARRAGATWLNLGGGLVADDSLWSFKASWSKHRFPARSYRRIFDQGAYDHLCKQAGVGAEDADRWFPGYRAKEGQ